MDKILLLITTESTEKRAKYIAKLVIKNKLAACVSIKKIFSIYNWKGEIVEANEYEITIKSKPKLKEDLILFLKKISSYDTPQIIFNQFNSEAKFYDWFTKTI